MAFCRKCGAELSDNDVFCFSCGQPCDDQPNASTSETDSMSKEDSIALAGKLKTEYAAIERLQKEISENETALRRPITLSGSRYSAFRYFWPYLIYAFLLFNALFIFGTIIGMSAGSDASIIIAMFVCFGGTIGLLIFGGIRARRKRDSMNEELVEQENQINERFREIEKRTADLKYKLTNKNLEVSKYQHLVPMRFRTRYYMERVIYFLQTDKASSFSEAVRLLGE